MKLSNLKRIIAEELTRLGTSKLQKGRGCGKLNEAEEGDGQCMATINGVEVPCNQDCNDIAGCDMAPITWSHPNMHEGRTQEAACECQTGARGMTAPISDRPRRR